MGVKTLYNVSINTIQKLIDNSIYYNASDEVYNDLYLLDDLRKVDEFQENQEKNIGFGLTNHQKFE